jgi:glycerol-3-phosphate dehydrogenase
MTTAGHNIGFTDGKELLDAMSGGQSCDWDILIVGGGITGAGVLREAVRRGYRALLIEQNDFAWGTSSRSSKMIHGGLRYLSTGDLKLTRDSLGERERLLSEAPGLVDRLGYYFTLRKGIFPGRLAFTFILKLYDFIAGIRDHKYINNQQLGKKFDGLSQAGLTGACYYTDAVTDDSRLVLRVLQESIELGGSALNHTRVEDLLIENGQVCGVVVFSANETQEPARQKIELRAPIVVNATGAWADKLRNSVNPEKRVRPLRGSHLVFPRDKLPVSDVLAFIRKEDGRAAFIYPWEGATVVGTTDLDHGFDLNIEARITEDEVNYLLESINSQFPRAAISTGDVISTFSGVRPVIGSEKSKNPSKERRDHAVWSDKGLITVSGGKLTTFRLIALDVLRMAKDSLPIPREFKSDCVFKTPVLKGKDICPKHPEWGERLLGRYGDLARSVVASTPPNEQGLIEKTLFTLSECRWAVRCEAVVHLDDLLLRRTRLGLLLTNGGESIFEDLKLIFMQELSWEESQWESELDRYRAIISNYYSLPS